MTNQTSLKKNFFLDTAYQLLSIITPFITAPYLARVLGSNNIGINSYTNSILSYFSMFAVLGTSTYGSREISRTRDDLSLNSKCFWEIELLVIFTSTIMIVFWGIFVFLTNQYKILYLILSLNLISNIFNISWFYKGREQFVYTVSCNTFVKVAGIILIFLLVREQSHLWRYVLIISSTQFIGNLTMWIPLHKFLIKIDVKSFRFKVHLVNTLIYFVPTIAVSIYQVLDKTLLGLITKDLSENGYYEESNKIIGIVKAFCYTSISSVIGTRNSYLYEKGKFDEIKEKIKKTIDFVMFMSVGAAFGLIGISKSFIPFFLGIAFEKSIVLLQLMSITLPIIGISVLMSELYYIPANLRKKSCFFEISGAVINLILNLCLIPVYKSIGAVIGTIIAEIIIALLYIIFSKGFITFKIVFMATWKKIISGIVMLTYLLLVQKLSISFPLLLVLQILIGIIIYISVLLLLKDCNVYLFWNIIKNKFLKSKIIGDENLE